MLSVVGVNVQVVRLMMGVLLPVVREVRVTVSLLLLLLQTYEAVQRAFSSIVPPLILPTLTVSVVAQGPLLVVLPTHTVVALAQTVLPVTGPVVVSIDWLKLKMNWSPASSLLALTLINWTLVATTPTWTPATGLFRTLLHDW